MKNVLMYSVVALLIVLAVLSLVKRSIVKKLINSMSNGDFETFEKESDKLITKIVVSRVDLSYFRLKSAFVQQSKKKIAQALEEIEPLLFSKKQKGQVYMDAFNYYISIEDEKNSKKYLDKIRTELDDQRMKIETSRVYNIFIKKTDVDLQSLLDECDDLLEENRAVNEYLISVIYKNKGDKAKSKEYADLSKKHMEILDGKISEKLNKK